MLFPAASISERPELILIAIGIIISGAMKKINDRRTVSLTEGELIIANVTYSIPVKITTKTSRSPKARLVLLILLSHLK